MTDTKPSRCSQSAEPEPLDCLHWWPSESWLKPGASGDKEIPFPAGRVWRWSSTCKAPRGCALLWRPLRLPRPQTRRGTVGVGFGWRGGARWRCSSAPSRTPARLAHPECDVKKTFILRRWRSCLSLPRVKHLRVGYCLTHKHYSRAQCYETFYVLNLRKIVIS